MEEEKRNTEPTDPKREKVRVIPLSQIVDAPDHPFQVRDDDEMMSLIESVATFGVISPVIARRVDEDKYELISGHRRKYACVKLGKDSLPAIVRDMTREQAIIYMVDSNLQREHILPSERAWAYRMKMDAMRKTAGRPPKNNLSPMATNIPIDTAAILAEGMGESRDQVFRYIRLTYLVPELLEDVDIGKLSFRPAVELSYLSEEEQKDVSYVIDEEEATVSLAQACELKKQSQAGILDMEHIEMILGEDKKNEKHKIKLPTERIVKYFAKGTSSQEMEETIIKALDLYRRMQEKARQQAQDRSRKGEAR